MKEARGQNKLFQNASPLMCCCSFTIGHFLILKNQYERQAIELLFKVQISLDRPSSNTKLEFCFYVHTPFCEPYNAFNGISHKKLLPFFSKPMGIFIRLSRHILRAEVQTNR